MSFYIITNDQQIIDASKLLGIHKSDLEYIDSVFEMYDKVTQEPRNLCRDNTHLFDSFTNSMIPSNNNSYLLVKSEDNTINGILDFKKGNTTMDIGYFCTSIRGVGKELSKNLNISQIKAYPLKSSIGFYTKMGFQQFEEQDEYFINLTDGRRPLKKRKSKRLNKKAMFDDDFKPEIKANQDNIIQ
jgi:hypothetical protein